MEWAMTSDATFESIPREDAVEVTVGGESFVLATEKFVCPECEATMTDVVYSEVHEVEGVTALALGVECSACDYDTLHVSY